jgi:Fe2+ transport system protein FeoA
MNLLKAPIEQTIRITQLNLPDPKLQFRIEELGLRPNAEITIYQKTVFGGRILDIGNKRVAVDHKLASAIEIEVFGDDQ